jgi:hypothetical protein
VRLSLFIESEKAFYLSSRRTLTELKTSACPTVPAGRFMAVETRNGVFRLDFPWILSYQVSRKADGIEINTVLRDKNRCGISKWGSNKIIDGPQTYSLNVYCAKMDAVEDCLWLEPYPGGAQAALCLTDHADFDSIEKLRLLSDLYVKNDFRFTKSVFPKSDATPTKHEPAMDIMEYRKSIEKLYDAGCGIAYHGFGPRIKAPPPAECRNRLSLMREFNVATWIDHGDGNYLFSRQNVLEDGTILTDILGQYGVKNYWSFFDIWNNPFVKLSSWSLRTTADILHDLYVGMSSLKKLNIIRCAYLMDHAIKNIIGSYEFLELKQKPFRMNNWAKAYMTKTLLSVLRKGPFAIYGHDGTVFTCTSDSLWIFDTVLCNHLGIQLKPALIDSLTEDSGLLLAHCYFGAQNRHIFDNCFEGQGPDLSISSAFVKNIEYIAERQKAGDLITLSFAQLRASLETFSHSFISRNDYGWQVDVKGGSPLVMGGSRQAVMKLECAGAKKWYRGNIGFIMLPQGSNLIKNAIR